jgi:hypothetical protein
MISDRQVSEIATSAPFGMNPEKGRWILVALGLATNICRGSISSLSVFERPLRKLWSIDATVSLLPSSFFLEFFAPLTPLPEGPSTNAGPCRFNGYA